MSSQRLIALVAALLLLVAACADDTGSTDSAGEEGSDQTQAESSNDAAESASDTTEAAEANDQSDTAKAADVPAKSVNPAVLESAVSGDLTAEAEDCITSNALTDLSLSTSLVVGGDDADITDLSPEDQVRFSEIIIECSTPEALGQLLSDGFADGAGFASPPEMADCFTNALAAESGPHLLVGMASFDTDAPQPEQSKGPLVDTLTDCVPASLLSTVVTADPELAELADPACIEAAYGGNGDALRPLWEAMVENPDTDFDSLPPEVAAPLVEPILGCISMGKIVANEAAAGGVTLSDETITCIDVEATKLGVIDTIALGEEPDEADEAALGLAILDCMTPEELEAFIALG